MCEVEVLEAASREELDGRPCCLNKILRTVASVELLRAPRALVVLEVFRGGLSKRFVFRVLVISGGSVYPFAAGPVLGAIA